MGLSRAKRGCDNVGLSDLRKAHEGYRKRQAEHNETSMHHVTPSEQ
jgi:hypothetical protein